MYSVHSECWVNDLLDLDINLNDFSGKSDEELAVDAKTNKTAAAVLVSRYMKLIFIKSEIFANHNSDRDDLNQEGLIGLLNSISSFDADRGIRFSTFAETCINNRMKTFVAKGTKNAEKIISDPDEFSVVHSVLDYDTPESIYLYKENFSEMMNKISSVLSETERKVFNLCVQGVSYKDAAERLGITEKSVDNAMQRARRKIRALLK